MEVLRITSVEHPLDDPEVFGLATRLLARLDVMGVAGNLGRVSRLDTSTFLSILRRLATAGIAVRPVAELGVAERSTGTWARLLRAVDRAIEETPLPDEEWPRLMEVVGPDALAGLLGISQSSLRRYAGGERATPDEVAERLHFLALLVADLAGAYNEIGIRRWFERPRTALDGRKPRQILRPGWSPASEGPQRIRELARSLAGSPAT